MPEVIPAQFLRLQIAAASGPSIAIPVLNSAAALVDEYAGRLTVIEGRYGDMGSVLAESGVAVVDGIALDLGVSSMQLDDADRGFSFRNDGPLDMRQEQYGAPLPMWLMRSRKASSPILSISTARTAGSANSACHRRCPG